MADLHRLPSDEELRSVACTWIARLNAHNASNEDRTQFESWRSAHPRHARAYNLVSRIWQHMAAAGEIARAVNVGQTFNAITEAAIRRSLERRARSRQWATAAAVATVALGLAGWLYTRAPGTVFQTAVGEHAAIKLPDGSSLELNSNSRARLAYDSKVRIVQLERGEAYFDVERDARRPFWVSAGKSWVGAIGTAFNVDMRKTELRVTVSEGAVKVASDPRQISAPILKAGEQVNVEEDARRIRTLPPAQLAQSLAWRRGSVYFKDGRLSDVVDELSRYTRLRMVIEDKGLRDFAVGGTFETGPEGAETLLVNLQEGFGLKVHRDGSTAYISR